MSTITEILAAFRDPTPQEVPAGSVIRGGQFRQHTPGTPIMAGRALTIRGGNFQNVAKDAAWTIEGGNWGQKNLCTNLQPYLVDKGLTECAENCSHVVDTDVIEGEGGSSVTIYHYKHTPVN